MLDGDRGLHEMRSRGARGASRGRPAVRPRRSPARPTCERSWSGSRTSLPSASTRASRRESCNSISASRPIASPSSGISCHQHAREPDRLRAQPGAHGRAVARVEDQVDGGEDAAQAVREVGVARDLVADAGAGDLRLGARDPLRHRALGDQEGARHLGRRQPAERAQRQADPRLGRERRVAGGEDQAQALVGDRAHGLRVLVALVLAAAERRAARPRARPAAPPSASRSGSGRARGCAPR